jgi:hypothetical protein
MDFRENSKSDNNIFVGDEVKLMALRIDFGFMTFLKNNTIIIA